MTHCKTGAINTTMSWQRTATAALFWAPLVAAPLGANAQEAITIGEDETYRLAPIIVNSQAAASDDASTVVAQELWVGGKVATSILNTPASVSVVTQKEMEQRSVSTTEELLQYTPGVVTDFYGSDDRNDYFKIRGFQATTYRDGLTLGSMRGVREEPFAYERVEVLRGANSTLFGAADPGGSVNFVTKKPRFEKFGQVYGTYGSFNHKETGVDVGDTLNEDKTLAYRLTGKFQDSDREYDHSRDDNGFAMGGLTWAPTAYTSATLVVDHLKTKSSPNSGGYPMDREYDRSDFFGEPDYNFHDVERTNISGDFSHDFDNGFVLRSNLRYSDLTDDFGYVYLGGGGTGTVRDRVPFASYTEAEQVNGNVMLQYDARFENIDSSTMVGVEYGDSSSDQSSSFRFAVPPIDIANPVYSGAPVEIGPDIHTKRDYTTKSVFLQQNLSFYERFIVTAGARHDSMDLAETNKLNSVKTSDNFSENTVRGALTYIVTDEVSTYVSMAESVSPPEIGVTPKRGKQYEVGVKYSPMGMNALFSAAIYDLTQENVSIAVVVPGNGIQQQTVGETNVQGLELEAKAELTENLSVVGGYSYMKSDVTRGALSGANNTVISIKGNEFEVAPQHSASLWGYYNLPGTKMSVGAGARYVGSYYYDAFNTGKSEATTLFDTAFNYNITKGTDLAINVSNLLDEQHVVGSGTANYYNPGREVTAKVSYNW